MSLLDIENLIHFVKIKILAKYFQISVKLKYSLKLIY